MDRLNMSLQIYLLCELMITEITRILDLLMNRLNMSFQISLLCILMITQNFPHLEFSGIPHLVVSCN